MKIQQVLDSVDLTEIPVYYCDLRVEERERTMVRYKNGEWEECVTSPSFGAFLRVYNNGKWFYLSTTDFSDLKSDFEKLAVDSAKAKGQNRDLFSAVPVKHNEKLTVGARDPRRVPLAKKKELVQSYDSTITAYSEVKERVCIYADTYHLKGFKSSRGTSYIYDYADYSIGALYVLRRGDSLVRDIWRHYDTEFANLHNRQSELKAEIDETLPHLGAEAITPGKYTVVMDSEVVGVFTHESFGHKSEADAMLGDESAVKEWEIGKQIATPLLSIVDEGSIADSSGYVPFDDEGFPAQKNYLIKNGKLAGRLHSLETASAMGEKPTGNGRAINFEFEPIVRMTSTYIEAGTDSFEQMISRVKKGIFVKGYRYGTGLSTFTIAPVKAYWIRDGKMAEPVRVSVISGSVFETLRNITAVSKNYNLKNSNIGGCGKDEQMPLRVSDGGPDIIVEGMQVG